MLATVTIAPSLFLPIYWSGEFNDPVYYPIANKIFFGNVTKGSLASLTKPVS